jgi:hypothetical protein
VRGRSDEKKATGCLPNQTRIVDVHISLNQRSSFRLALRGFSKEPPRRLVIGRVVSPRRITFVVPTFDLVFETGPRHVGVAG